MKKAILVGGPFDGKATEVTDNCPYIWRIINPSRPKVFDLDKPAVASEIHMQVFMYKREMLNWPVQTDLEFYTFYGVE